MPTYTNTWEFGIRETPMKTKTRNNNVFMIRLLKSKKHADETTSARLEPL